MLGQNHVYIPEGRLEVGMIASVLQSEHDMSWSHTSPVCQI